MAKKDDFNRDVPLPPGLTVTAIQKAIEYIEKGLADLVKIYLEQANVFGAIVGIYGVKALDATSVYEKNRHLDLHNNDFPTYARKVAGQIRVPIFLWNPKRASDRGQFNLI